MSRVVVLGAGISGHTTASFVKRWLGPGDTVTVISPNSSYNWIPSNIWVGVGLMRPSQVTFPLAPVYERHGIEFVHAAARQIHPEGDAVDPTPYVTVEPTGKSGEGANARVKYDFLINATGPKLRFDKTEGLGPDGHSLSVCTVDDAVQTAAAFDEAVARMRGGERQRFLVGVGHGTCTCEGAAFEYIVNLEFELRARKVRDKADIVWITNEYELGDFGMGGMHIKSNGYMIPSSIFAASLFAERGSLGSPAPTSRK
jgi:sulfide:quinone oxidoreductase